MTVWAWAVPAERTCTAGVVQATALAPTAVEAEWRAKAAVLSGPGGAGDWLAHGGVIVLDDGDRFVVSANSQPRPSRLSPTGSTLVSHLDSRSRSTR